MFTLEIQAGAVGHTELAADAVTNAKISRTMPVTENIMDGTYSIQVILANKCQ